MTWIFDKSSLENISKPVQIIATKADKLVSASSIKELEQVNPKINIKFIKNEKASHFVFLNETTEFGKTILPKYLYQDAQDVRQEVHKKYQISLLIFLKRTYGYS